MKINRCDGFCRTCWYVSKHKDFHALISSLRQAKTYIEGNEICLQLMRKIDDLNIKSVLWREHK